MLTAEIMVRQEYTWLQAVNAFACGWVSRTELNRFKAMVTEV